MSSTLSQKDTKYLSDYGRLRSMRGGRFTVVPAGIWTGAIESLVDIPSTTPSLTGLNVELWTNTRVAHCQRSISSNPDWSCGESNCSITLAINPECCSRSNFFIRNHVLRETLFVSLACWYVIQVCTWLDKQLLFVRSQNGISATNKLRRQDNW